MSTPDFVPAEDAAEQQLPAAADDTPADEPETGQDAPEALPLEADPADAAEQAVVVPHDDEDGRD